MQDKASKCHHHPSDHAVAACDGCGVDLCLRCALPVRGEVLGPECLPEDLRGATPSPTRRPRPSIQLPLAAIGAAVALIASLLSWKRYGLGAGVFGAWGLTPRWSILAGVAALAATVLWIALFLSGARVGRGSRTTLRVLGGVIAGASLLHLLNPPGFGPVSLGPWAAIVGGILLIVGTGDRDRGSVRVP